jgi:ATP-dependent DNA helicase RecQ
MRRNGHDTLSTFGIGRDVDEATWKSVARQLVARGELATTEHDGLRLTERGVALMRGEGELHLGRRAVGPARTAARSRGAVQRPADALDEVARLRFERLRAVRLELARAQGVPAYVVLDDAGLAAIARDVPRDEAGLLRIPGIGRVKLERYGAALLDAVREE